VKPEKPGVSFYRVRAAAKEESGEFDHPEQSKEATLANNTRLAVVDRGEGPYRVLYISGRPNWEYKFLQRSVAPDDQVQLVGFIRIARREPKFNFIGQRPGKVDTVNPLYRGFAAKDREQAEQYDQPVIIRMGTEDQDELKGGFPKTAEELFRYHAIIVQDVEAEFFTQDQMQLIKEFVRQRGGGLLMLGGEESFKNGKYDQTPVGDMLPVYVDGATDLPVDTHFRLALTREGWLEPWLRLRPEESAERQRLAAMPEMDSVNPIRGIKPGATVLAQAVSDEGEKVPALVAQRFGQGRVGAMLIGDLWRWELGRPNTSDADMEKAWRQMTRWLVSDVPKRLEVAIDSERQTDDAEGTVRLHATVRDAAYALLDNAVVTIKVTPPDGKPVELRADPSAGQPGRYDALYVSREAGPYRAEVMASAPDGSDVGRAEAGWAADPAAEEFRDLQPNRALLERIAKATGGEMVDADALDGFVATLPTRRAPITEPFIQPAWHQSWVFLVAIACLAAEWGLRRWRGLP
jgi:uncharacterized membrane protein